MDVPSILKNYCYLEAALEKMQVFPGRKLDSRSLSAKRWTVFEKCVFEDAENRKISHDRAGVTHRHRFYQPDLDDENCTYATRHNT